jgi:hypothetical protein
MTPREPSLFEPGEPIALMCEAARETAVAEAERRRLDWDRVDAIRKRRRLARRAALAGGMLAAAGVAALLLWPAPGEDRSAVLPAHRTADAPPPAPRYRIVRPSDAVYVVAEETARWTLASAAELALSSGTVWVRVDSTEGPVPFEVRTPEASVRVEGTRFAVARRPESGTSVFALDGRVRVVREGRTFVVHGGMQWEPGDAAPMPLEPARRVRLADLLPDTVAVAVPRGPGGDRPTEVPADPGAPVPPDLPSDGPEGLPAESEPAVLPAGSGEPVAPAGPSAGEHLYRRAEEAMATGRMDEAVALLWRVVEREPRSARAGLALMDLGRLTQRLGRPAEAARAFGRYLELQPNGSFRDDARAGLCRALARSGDDGAARSCYASYLAEFPRGAHAGEAGRYGGDSPP